MNSSATTKTRLAFTLIELLVVIALVAILAVMLLPTGGTGGRPPATQLQCMTNLKQVNLGLIMYWEETKGLFPWQISTNAGGTEELIPNGIATDHFSKVAPYVHDPRLFICPTDGERKPTKTNFVGFSNTNLSYFLAFDAVTNSANSVLAGDRLLAFSNQPVKSGLFSLTNSTAMGWTKQLHSRKKSAQTMGVLAFADGHAEVAKTQKLPAVFQRQPLATNRLVIP